MRVLLQLFVACALLAACAARARARLPHVRARRNLDPVHVTSTAEQSVATLARFPCNTAIGLAKPVTLASEPPAASILAKIQAAARWHAHAGRLTATEIVFAVVARYPSGIHNKLVSLEAQKVARAFGNVPHLDDAKVKNCLTRLANKTLAVANGPHHHIAAHNLIHEPREFADAHLPADSFRQLLAATRAALHASFSDSKAAALHIWYTTVANALVYPTAAQLAQADTAPNGIRLAPPPAARKKKPPLAQPQHSLPEGWVSLSDTFLPDACKFAQATMPGVRKYGKTFAVHERDLARARDLCFGAQASIARGLVPVGYCEGDVKLGTNVVHFKRVEPESTLFHQGREAIRAYHRDISDSYRARGMDEEVDDHWTLHVDPDNPLLDPAETHPCRHKW